MGGQEKTKRVPNFSLAFHQMASFAAIARTRNTTEVLDQLVQQCFIVLPDETFSVPRDISDCVETLFGIGIPENDVALSINRLMSKKLLLKLVDGQLALPPEERSALENRFAEARKLEGEIKSEWLSQVARSFPELEANRLWRTLKDYLGQAFRRHGVLVSALLDPNAAVAQEHVQSLSTILETVLTEEFGETERKQAHEAITSFMSGVRGARKRAEYVTQLADGAFNYFSLAVDPEVSMRLREKLSPLVLFMDTNFLLGILELHINPQGDVSKELLEAIREFTLPFELRYHEATQHELTRTIHYFSRELSKRKSWPQQISRAALSAGVLSGIELRYHQMNAESQIDVEDFLAKFRHCETLLQGIGITIYRVDSSEARLRRRADIEADYKAFCDRIGRKKPYEAIQHDAAVLETVRSLRSDADSTLEAKAILLTCDYFLCCFDKENSHTLRGRISTLLPSLLWQLLRPFISNNPEFDEAFAETFALPEFTLTRGGAQRAAAKMLSILAGYRDIPEETAFRMLTDDLLTSALETKKTDQEFVEAVESALAKENVQLLEEKAALEEQVSQERKRREQQDQQLDAAAKLLEVNQAVLAKKENALSEKGLAIQDLEAKSLAESKLAKQSTEQVDKERKKKEQAEARSKQEADLRTAAENRALRTAKIASIVVGVLTAMLFLSLVNFVIRWDWLLEHPNGYGIQGCMSFMFLCLIVGTWVRPWRGFLWAAGASFLLLLLQIIGGVRDT